MQIINESPAECCAGSGMPCPTTPKKPDWRQRAKMESGEAEPASCKESLQVQSDPTAALLETRAADYGPPEINMTGIGLIWTAQLRNHWGIPDLPIIGPEMVALMMAGLKLNRLAKSPKHTDSYDDARGYLRIAEGGP